MYINRQWHMFPKERMGGEGQKGSHGKVAWLVTSSYRGSRKLPSANTRHKQNAISTKAYLLG